jgi:hypothetical protein
MNLDQGLDVRAWLDEGLIDFVIPVLYTYTDLDPDMPFDWVVEPAHEAGAAVYGFLQHYVRSDVTGAAMKEDPTPAMFRAAAASYFDRGVDGLCTYMLSWPLGVVERAILSELGDREAVSSQSKHYVLARRSAAAAQLGYDHRLPQELSAGDSCEIGFYIADDLQAEAERLATVRLRLYITGIVSADRFTIRLNGHCLADETCRRVRKTEPDTFPHSGPRNFWLDFDLQQVRPVHGANTLTVRLDHRPEGLEGAVTLQEVEIPIDYSPYPPGLGNS